MTASPISILRSPVFALAVPAAAAATAGFIGSRQGATMPGQLTPLQIAGVAAGAGGVIGMISLSGGMAHGLGGGGTLAAAAAGAVLGGAAGVAAHHFFGQKVQGARESGTKIWAGKTDPNKAHITQHASQFNHHVAPAEVDRNANCVPAAIAMAARLVGRPAAGATAQEQINSIRQAGTGRIIDDEALTRQEGREMAAKLAGASDRLETDREISSALLAGKPVVLFGGPHNPGSYYHRRPAGLIAPRASDSVHAIAVIGFDRATGEYIVSDPLAHNGLLRVSTDELRAYRGTQAGFTVG